MRQREINRMTESECRRALADAAKELNSALNLFGVDDEPISGLLEPLTESEVKARLDEIMTPECSCRGKCDHAFPPAFMRAAQPAADRFLQLWRQIAKAPADRD